MTILVIDNLSQFTKDIISYLNQLNKKNVCKRYYEIPSDLNNYNTIILSGRQKNQKEINAINSYIVKSCFKNDIPLLGICYGAEIIALTFGGAIRKLEYYYRGLNKIDVINPFEIVPEIGQYTYYESHSYKIARLPDEFILNGRSDSCKYEIFSHKSKKIFGTQFHPEKSKDGLNLIQNFVNIL